MTSVCMQDFCESNHFGQQIENLATRTAGLGSVFAGVYATVFTHYKIESQSKRVLRDARTKFATKCAAPCADSCECSADLAVHVRGLRNSLRSFRRDLESRKSPSFASNKVAKLEDDWDSILETLAISADPEAKNIFSELSKVCL